MAEQEKDKRLDDLLDSLLAHYSSAEPRPGFETKILAGMKEAVAQGKPWFWNLRWLAAGAAGAAVVAVIMFVLFSRTAPRPQPPVARNLEAPPAQVTPPQVTPAKVVVVPKTVGVPQVSPKPHRDELAVAVRQEVFPTPTPLSEQERLLLRYVATTPREEVLAQSHPDEPPADVEPDTAPPRDLTHVPQRSGNTR